MDFIWDALIILPASFVFIRLAGKKTLSEMTTFEIIAVLSIGTMISHAINEKGAWKTIISMALIVSLLLVAQWLQMKNRVVERVFIGKATIVIENGIMNIEHLRKLRMTNEQLEMRLRQKGINRISMVKTATIEANGQLGYELQPQEQPVTRKELEAILTQLNSSAALPVEGNTQDNLFSKI